MAKLRQLIELTLQKVRSINKQTITVTRPMLKISNLAITETEKALENAKTANVGYLLIENYRFRTNVQILWKVI